MKFKSLLLSLSLALFACQQTPQEITPVPTAYTPQDQQKPLDPQSTGLSNQPPQPQGPDPVEMAFLQAYQNRRSPRIMILVNRTIHSGASLPPDTLEDVIRAGGTGPDVIAATPADYDMIEASIVDFFNRSGRVTVKDSQAARAKLEREKLFRIENGDPDAIKLLNAEFQTDILIRVIAAPTAQAQQGNACRLIARAVSTTDATYYGVALKDMHLPMSKTNISEATYYVARKLMDDMSRKLAGINDPLEVRVYKARTIDDGLLVRKFIQKTPGVTAVRTISSSGGATTSYSSFSVTFNGAPEDFYAAMKENVALSKGLKASDLTNNTLNLEVEGDMNLKVQTTRPNPTTGKPETEVVAITAGPE